MGAIFLDQPFLDFPSIKSSDVMLNQFLGSAEIPHHIATS
jgi:hypothetical protein